MKKRTIRKILVLITAIMPLFDVIGQNENYIKADNPFILYMGRIDFNNPKEPQFSFPGVTIKAKFLGTKITAVFKDLGTGTSQTTNYFNIIIDDVLSKKIALSSTDTLYTIASGLTEGMHTIELVKRTESSVGATKFGGFVIEQTNLLEPEALPSYKMEFIGDSWTCGYGNELSTNSPNTGFHSNYEDNYRAWGYTVAKKFNAQYHSTSISGRGLYRNNTGTTYGVIPDEFNKVIPGQPKLWDFNNYIPDLVVIHLGTNDFYPETLTPPDMLDSAAFVNNYIAFINTIRDKYGDQTKIICAFGNSKSDWWPENLKHLTRWRNYVTAVVNNFNKKGDNFIYKFELSVQNAPYGEDWHPTILTHNQMANEITPFIKSITGITPNNYVASTETITNTIPSIPQHGVHIYPNPVRDIFYLQGVPENAEWKIYDLTGALQLGGIGTTGNAEILLPGYYILNYGTTSKTLIKFQ